MKLRTLETVRAAMLEKLQGSLLTAADAAKLKFKPVTADQAKALNVPSAVGGFVIPYFNFDGGLTKFWRLRYLEDTRKGFDVLNGRKALRYVQPAGGINEVYLPPFTDWRELAAKAGHPLVITEGELKAACATKAGLPTIGLGGVWSYKSNKGGVSLLPMLKQITWLDRKTIICFDSDAVTNPLVVQAENALAKTLADAGALVQIARLPAGPKGEKVGLDDYLLVHEMSELMALLATASDFQLSAALHAMNEQVVYIRDPGLVYAYEGQLRMRSADFTAHAYANYWYDDNSTGKVLRKQTADAWVKWEHRNTLQKVTFKPGEPGVFENCLNLWSGWPIEPNKGDVSPWKKLLDHLFTGAEPAARVWFEQWCAYPLQNPGEKMASAAVFWGKVQGSGKTLVGHTLMRIYGEYSAEVTDDEIEDKRREWAENMQFVLADDITGTDNRRLSNKLKTMITQKYLKVDRKFVPRYSVPDCINYYFTSNAPDAFYLEDDDRRNFIHEVIAGVLEAVFRELYVKWKDSVEGPAALFDYFLKLDMTGFDPHGKAFDTQAKADMIHIGRSDLAAWVAELRLNTESTLKLPGDLFTAAELLTMYDPMRTGKVTANGMARELKKAGYRAPGNGAMAVTKFGNVRLYAIRNVRDWPKRNAKQIAMHYEQSRAVKVTEKVKF